MLQLQSSMPEQERGTGEERRAYVRLPGSGKANCSSLASASPSCSFAQVKDVSTLGIGLILDSSPELGALLEIELHHRNGRHLRTILARVVHVHQDTSRTWKVGCAFVEELPNEALAAFEAEAVHPASPDLRRWKRFPCNVETVCYSSDTAPGERCSGRILNVSAGGVGLLLRCEFAKGTLLFFELPQEFDLARNKLLVRVVQVIDQGAGWFHGCEFTDQLSDDETRHMTR